VAVEGFASSAGAPAGAALGSGALFAGARASAEHAASTGRTNVARRRRVERIASV